MNRQLNLSLAAIFLMLALGTQAQYDKIRFGKVSDEHLSIQKCDFYEEAKAMVISKIGDIRFEYRDQEGFQTVYTEHKVIKIFDKEAKDLGTISLVVYEPEAKINGQEKILKFKAFLHNYDSQTGKTDREKISNKEMFRTRLSKYRVEYTLTIPGVKAGSVIEYEYIIQSDFINNLRTWYFQEKYPVGYSKFTSTIPEWFNYSNNQLGNVIHLEMENFLTNEGFVNSGNGQSGLTSSSTTTKYEAQNILPIQDEPYMSNKVNLPSRIEFQLLSYQFPNSMQKVIATDYRKFNDNLMKADYFGKRLSMMNPTASKFVETIEGETEKEKLVSIFNWIYESVSWNKIIGPFPSQNCGETVRKGEGSIADTNMALVSAWRKAGIEAYPVILSTRENGTLHPVYPNDDKFNYMVAAAVMDGNLYLADATSDRPIGSIPEYCLNGKGWMVTENGGQWVNLKKYGRKETQAYSRLVINEEVIENNIQIKYSNLHAQNIRNEYKNNGEDEFKSDLLGSGTDGELTSFEWTDEPEDDQVEIKFSVEKVVDDPDLIYLKPIFVNAIVKNPFVREERISPIDFPCAIEDNEVVSIVIPEGYTPEELPQPTIVKLPNDGGYFQYNISQVGNQLMLVSKFSISKLDYTPTEYPALSQFFQLMTDKNNELIVLKRN